MAIAPTRPAPPAEPEHGLNRAISRNMLLFFVLGDVLGAGIYALVGEVGGRGRRGDLDRVLVVALLLAVFTAFAYAELVTKYPQAAGAALYVNKAFRLPFLTFMVAFAVMASGITSAATLVARVRRRLPREFVSIPTVLAALVFLTVVAAINFRGISESVQLNVGADHDRGVRAPAHHRDRARRPRPTASGDAGRAFEFKEGEGVHRRDGRRRRAGLLRADRVRGLGQRGRGDRAPPARLPARAVRRAADRRRHLPRRLGAGLHDRADRHAGRVRRAAAGGRAGRPLSVSTKVFAAIALFAVANGALINMIMASRLIYGMSRQGIVPRIFGAVHARRRTPLRGDRLHDRAGDVLISTGDLSDLADTTVLLLLVVFIVVNVSVLVLRRDRVDHAHFRAPTALPVIGVAVCIALMTEKTGETYLRAAILLGVGVAFWVVSRLITGPAPMDTQQLEAVARPDAPPPSS